jgi:lysozyme
MDFLVREEGVRRFAYNDSRNNATFGVGHLIHEGPVNDADRRKWGTPSNPKSMEFVEEVLNEDLDRFEATVRNSTKESRTKQNRFNAMLSLAFNIGQGGFAGSTVVRRHNAGDIRGAGEAFMMWDNPPELRPRRSRERALYLR